MAQPVFKAWDIWRSFWFLKFVSNRIFTHTTNFSSTNSTCKLYSTHACCVPDKMLTHCHLWKLIFDIWRFVLLCLLTMNSSRLLKTFSLPGWENSRAVTQFPLVLEMTWKGSHLYLPWPKECGFFLRAIALQEYHVELVCTLEWHWFTLVHMLSKQGSSHQPTLHPAQQKSHW